MMDALLYQTDCMLVREEFEIVSGHQPQNALMLIKEGSFVCTFSDEATFTAEPGDVVFFPMRRGFVRHVTAPCKFHLIYFALSADNPLCNYLPTGKVVFSDRRRVETDACRLEELLDRTDAAATAIKKHLLNDIFLQYCCENAPAENRENTPSPQIAAILRYFEAHVREKITQKTLCELTNMSAASLTRHFRKETGVTPIEYLIHLRLRNARKDLIQTRDSVSDIATRWGYENIYYFSNAFKRIYGCSPTEYRKNAPKA